MFDGASRQLYGPKKGEYARARYYMSALGRWTSIDSLVDDLPAWSAYAYTYDNPIGFSDPLGRRI